jgi:hypothetical protein
MRRLLLGLASLALGTTTFFWARTANTVHLPAPPPHLPTAPADEDDVRWSARGDLSVPERREAALWTLGFLGHPEDADVLWRLSLDEEPHGALATSLLGRVSREDPTLRERLLALAADPDSLYRAQAVEAVGDLGAPGLERLLNLGDVEGVAAGLLRSRDGAATTRLSEIAEWDHWSMLQTDPGSVDVLEGDRRLEALALHDPARARLELANRLDRDEVDETTRRMIQALPPHGPWLDAVYEADAPLADRAKVLLHFDPGLHSRLVDDQVFPDPRGAWVLHGPSVETLRHADDASDADTLADVVGASFPGGVPADLVDAVLASEGLAKNWLQLPDFLAAAATPAALERLVAGTKDSRVGISWVSALAKVPDPAGAAALASIAAADDVTDGVRIDATKALLQRGTEHVEAALAVARADLGVAPPGYTGYREQMLLDRGTPADVEDVLALCVDGTRTECEAVVDAATGWSSIDRLVAIAEGADDARRALILTKAMRRGKVDDRIHVWLGDDDPEVAGAALARLPEASGDDLVERLQAELAHTDPEHQQQIMAQLRQRDPDAAAAALRRLDDPSKALRAFSMAQDALSRSLRASYAGDERPSVRAAALSGMRLGGAEEEAMCVAGLADAEPTVRKAAAGCISFSGTSHAAKQLARAYREHGHPEILEALEQLGGPEAEAFQ